MALTVTLTQVEGAIANRATRYVVAISSDVATQLQAVSVSEISNTGLARIEQPNFLVPQMPVGLGLPTLLAGVAVSYGFGVVWNAPRFSGPSPQTLPSPAGIADGQPPSGGSLQVQVQTSDGSVGFAVLTVPVLSAVPIFPKPEGGAAVFTQGNNANLIAVI